MISTLADVAKAAGVHPGTASKALNPETRHRVADDTVKRVLAIAKKLNYQPNNIARSLRTRKTGTVGLLVPDLTNALFPPIVRGVETVLSRHGLHALVVNTDNNPEKANQLFSTLRLRQCDGFILATAFRNDPIVDELAERNIPAVLVNRLTDKKLLPSVAGDEWSAIHAAVDHLIGLGHTRIAHIAGPRNISNGSIRRAAFLDAVEERKLKKEHCPVIVASEYSEEAGEAALLKLFATSKTRPTAIIAGNDQIAIGAIDGLRKLKLSCPEDVSVIGFNDSPLVDRLQPSLTTLHLPKHQLGEDAAVILQEIMSGERTQKAEAHLLPCDLIVRNSTARVSSKTVR